MSSSWRNIAKRVTHKERGQLASRRKLGMLEKKKDYRLRAKDYHRKQQRLQVLREKAALRNQDEYYNRMTRARVKDGKHVDVAKNTQKHTAETLKKYNKQDLDYLRLKAASERKKISQLEDSVAFVELAAQERARQVRSKIKSIKKARRTGRKLSEREQQRGLGKHTVFVDTEDQADAFDAATYFDTLPEFVDRTFNRPRTAQLQNQDLLTNPALASLKNAGLDTSNDPVAKLAQATNIQDLEEAKQLALRSKRKRNDSDDDSEPDEHDLLDEAHNMRMVAQAQQQIQDRLDKRAKKDAKKYREMQARKERIANLLDTAKQLETQKNLMAKGKRRKKANGEYKWAKERKR